MSQESQAETPDTCVEPGFTALEHKKACWLVRGFHPHHPLSAHPSAQAASSSTAPLLFISQRRAGYILINSVAAPQSSPLHAGYIIIKSAAAL